jgi:hypothetical protein
MSDTTERVLPWVCGNEDGDGYSGPGHIDPVVFAFAVVLDLAENVGDEEALDVFGPKRNGWRQNLVGGLADFVTGVHHVWMRSHPENDELLLGCEPTDEGAEPWTTVTLG